MRLSSRLSAWLVFTAGFILAQSLVADTLPKTEQLQITQCLAAKLRQHYRVLAENKHFKIIDLPVDEIEKLALLADALHCGRFVNVSKLFIDNKLTTKQQLAKNLLLDSIPRQECNNLENKSNYDIQQNATVDEAFTKINQENILATLTHLTSYSNRSATKKTGIKVAEWLKEQFENMAIESDRSDTATFFVKTGRYKQPSLVTVMGKDIKAPAVVIGAHMDTLGGHMPGASDDASGSAVVMEMARILLNSSFSLKRPVYVIWYAAEERGLVGSQYVVQHFLDNLIPVKAVIQFDMVGYRREEHDPTMWIFRDYTDPQLTEFVAQLIETYIKVPVAYSQCGYGCSDHVSWMAARIPAAFPCETSFETHNPFIHTPRDTMDLLNTEHLINFTKLALAFAIELASSSD